ncbi:MAG: hypothetical protein NTW33_00785 [Methanoregula sp.]|nr:hypothetical protein [Methanoregula sp.]
MKILIKGMEKDPKHRLRKSPKGQDFLLVTLVFENLSANDALLSPDQEMRLIPEGVSTPLPPDNYYFDTRIDSNGRTEGSLLFIVPQQASRFTLRFGKKTLPPVKVMLAF